jgi:anti-sigma B factor antagonist
MSDDLTPIRISATSTGLTVSGEIDASTASRVVGAIAALGGSVVELDLSSVSFIDSSGLRMLIELNDAISAHDGGTLTVVRPSPPVRRLFEISGVESYLSIVD